MLRSRSAQEMDAEKRSLLEVEWAASQLDQPLLELGIVSDPRRLSTGSHSSSRRTSSPASRRRIAGFSSMTVKVVRNALLVGDDATKRPPEERRCPVPRGPSRPR